LRGRDDDGNVSGKDKCPLVVVSGRSDRTWLITDVKLRMGQVFERASYFGGDPIRTNAVQLGGSLVGKVSSRLSSIRSSARAVASTWPEEDSTESTPSSFALLAERSPADAAQMGIDFRQISLAGITKMMTT
jgi:hypothetical protein